MTAPLPWSMPLLDGFEVRPVPSAYLARIAAGLERAAREAGSELLATKLIERAADLRGRQQAVRR